MSASSPGPAFRDQRTGLIVLGIIQILIGGVLLLMAPFLLASATMAMPGQPPGAAVGLRGVIPAVVMYVLMGTVAIALGVGSIRARRWAQALTVILSWMWLVMGVASMGVMACYGPKIMAAAQQAAQQAGGPQAQMPPQAFVIMQIAMFGTMGCLYVLFPVAFLLFYQRRAVYLTCQQRDPQVRWTDRCPWPVLALSLMHASGALSIPCSLAMAPAAPFFGFILTGLPAVAMMVFLALLLAWLARGTYRLQRWAWWTTLVFWLAGSVSLAITARRVGLMALFEKANLPAAQLAQIRQMGMADLMDPLRLPSLVMWIAMLAYLLYLRRYFLRAAHP